MPRLISASILRSGQRVSTQSFVASRRSLTSTPSQAAKNETSPGWTGRQPDQHAVNRTGHDAQSDASKSGMKKHEDGEEGSQGLSRKDEGNFNEKAKKDFPEAPDTIIGMNDERGGKGT